MLKTLLVVSGIFTVMASPACAESVPPQKILNLNIFDQLQIDRVRGPWPETFRPERVAALSQWIRENSPDLVVLQEARGELPGRAGGGEDSSDSIAVRDIFPFRAYVHEMTGADGASYGYWMGAKTSPTLLWSDGFFFPGGVERKTQAAVWQDTDGKCLGVLSLHMSYQNNGVREKEASWILEKLDQYSLVCKNWLVVGDFNADEENPEMQILFKRGLKSLVKDKRPTIGAYNPIRRIYGENISSRTIDWVLTNGPLGRAEIVFNEPFEGVWISDHAGVWVDLAPHPAGWIFSKN